MFEKEPHNRLVRSPCDRAKSASLNSELEHKENQQSGAQQFGGQDKQYGNVHGTAALDENTVEPDDDCNVIWNLAGAVLAAVLAQACETPGCKAGDDRKVEAVEEKYHFRGIGEQVITSFIILQVPGAPRWTRCTLRPKHH